ncbi:MAG: class I SAM-dependent methyltransferase [Desulfobacteraceae bacterium]|nr:class I SAM-dependent methyltransferase [Desulfobacteraceae bacterium]
MDRSNDSISSCCPYCKSARTRWYYVFDNETVRHCLDCNLIFRQRKGSEEEIFEYYRDSYYGEWGEDQEGCVRETIYLDALRFMEKHVNKGVLFDIGAGSGTLLALARDRGWKTAGQEISLESCRMAKEKRGLELINENLRDMDWQVSRYDAITMVNVLDHLPDPWWVLGKVFNALRRGGIIYIRVPNGYIHSCFYRISDAIPIKSLKEKMRKFLVIHLYHLTPQFFERVLRDSGFGSIIIHVSKVSRGSPYLSFTSGETLCLFVMKKYFSILPKLIYKLTKGRLIFSASINVYAFKD